jgi:hypothetical protein
MLPWTTLLTPIIGLWRGEGANDLLDGLLQQILRLLAGIAMFEPSQLF